MYPTSSLGFQNFFQATLTSDITDTSTDIPMDNVPSVSEGYLVINPDSASSREVIYYNSKTATKVVCPDAANGRGQDGTTAAAHSTGTTVIMAPVAAMFEALQSGDATADDSVQTRHVADASITSRKAALSIVGADGDTVNPMTTTEADIPNSSVTFTVDVDSYIFVTMSAELQNNAATNCAVYLNVDGTNDSRSLIKSGTGTSTPRSTDSRTFKIALSAGSHTIKLRQFAGTASAQVVRSPSWYGIIIAHNDL